MRKVLLGTLLLSLVVVAAVCWLAQERDAEINRYHFNKYQGELYRNDEDRSSFYTAR